MLPIHRLGGLFRLSGLTPGEIAGPNTLYGSLIAYRRIANPRFFTLNLPVYVGGSVEAGNAYAAIEEIDAASLIVAGSVFLGLDTPLGPLYVAYGTRRRTQILRLPVPRPAFLTRCETMVARRSQGRKKRGPGRSRAPFLWTTGVSGPWSL